MLFKWTNICISFKKQHTSNNFGSLLYTTAINVQLYPSHAWGTPWPIKRNKDHWQEPEKNTCTRGGKSWPGRGRRRRRGRSSSTLSCWQGANRRGRSLSTKGRSQWEDQPQWEVVVKGGVRHRKISALWTSSSSSFRSSNSLGESSPPWASRASDKISTSGALSRRHEHRELLRQIQKLHRCHRRIENTDKFRVREP